MRAEVLRETREMTREEWLMARRQGIGGSDVSAIAGLNKWKSAVEVYFDKLDESPVEDITSEAAYFGNVLEEVVAQEFSKRTGLKVRRRNAILVHPQYTFMLANVDRFIVGRNEGLECKTASEYLRNEWEGDEVPTAYLLQIQHYMAVTGMKAWHIAVLIGGNKFVHKRIERDEELIQYLLGIEQDFWVNQVLAKIPPEFDGSEASSKLLKAMYPQSDSTAEIVLPQETEAIVEAMDVLTDDIKKAELQKAEYENQLKALIGENEKAYAGSRQIIWKTQSSKRIDSKRLKAELPELFEQYTNVSTSRRFTVK